MSNVVLLFYFYFWFHQADTTESSSPESPPTITTNTTNTGSEKLERWGSDPLCLTPPEGYCPKLGGSRGARLAARGAAQDKANVVCQIAAVEALLKGSLPCGVKVIVGATPPPGSLSGNASLEVADRLTDFLKAHPSVTGLPDLVVVSEVLSCFSCWYALLCSAVLFFVVWLF